MKNGLATTIKVFGYLILALGLIGSFFLAGFERDAALSLGENYTTVFWTTLLTYALFSILACLLLLGLSEIIELLTKIEHNTFETMAQGEENETDK